MQQYHTTINLESFGRLVSINKYSFVSHRKTLAGFKKWGASLSRVCVHDVTLAAQDMWRCSISQSKNHKDLFDSQSACKLYIIEEKKVDV